MAFRRSRQDNHRASNGGVMSWRFVVVVVVNAVTFLLLTKTTTTTITAGTINNKTPIFCTASSVTTSSPSPSSSSGRGWRRRRRRFSGPNKDQDQESTELDNEEDSKAKQPWWKIRSTTKSSATTKSLNLKATDSKATKKEETKKNENENAKKSDVKDTPKGKKETDRKLKEDGSKPAKKIDLKHRMHQVFGLQKSEPKKDDETKDKNDEKEGTKEDKDEPGAAKSVQDGGQEDTNIDKSEEMKNDSKDDTANEDGPKDDDAKVKKKEQVGQLSPSSFSGLPPGAVIYRARPIPSSSSGRGSLSNSPASPSDVMTAQTTALVAMTVVNAMQTLTRLWFIQWIARKIAGDSELMTPQQHFTWECLNDKYSRDEKIWKNVLTRKLPPASMQLGRREWNKFIKGMKPKKRKKEGGDGNGGSGLSFGALLPSSSPKGVGPAPPCKTVVLVDLSTTKQQLDVDYLADVVTFLVAAHNGVRTKQLFGPEPEIVFNLESGGGEVTAFALAAAQLARLRVAGWKVTACINRIAASGGYMMASQATQIVAAPFAIVGSIGVIGGGLNFNKVLESYGVKAIEIKSGERKNPLSQFGSVTDKDIQIAQDNADENHRDFINLCLARRPMLNEGVCDGRIVNGDKALQVGLIDRILTSEEYIFEKIADGDLVMKLHRSNRQTDRSSFAQALQILPHLGHKMKMFFSAMTGFGGSTIHAGTNFGGPQLNPELVNKIFQGVAFLSMVHSALKRSGHFGSP